MKLETSQMLTRLSEQERNKVESELAKLNIQKCQLEERLQSAKQRIKQLNQQRDQALKTRNAASLLSIFDTAFCEQQLEITHIQANLQQLKEIKQANLNKLTEAQKTHHIYEGVHKKEQKKQIRRQVHKTQRQLDELSATRATSVAV